MSQDAIPTKARWHMTPWETVPDHIRGQFHHAGVFRGKEVYVHEWMEPGCWIEYPPPFRWMADKKEIVTKERRYKDLVWMIFPEGVRFEGWD